MIRTAKRVNIDATHKAILQTVLYHDIFKYPLNEKEIAENTACTMNAGDLKKCMNELLTYGYLKQVKNYFMPHWADIDNVARREKANERAQQMMKTAFEHSKKVARLPFIKGLCISGSLSKNYFDDRSDIDFFVITKADRLWICRSLFAVYYKFLPQKKKKLYCLNYFISEADLRIEDKNIFVGTELAALIPTVNYDMYKQLLLSNEWYKEWFKNKPENDGANCVKEKRGFVKRTVEVLFSGKWGDDLDEYLRNRTAKRWKKLFADMDSEQFELQFRSRKHSAKRHESGYQTKVLNALDQKIRDLEDTFQQKLN